VLNSVAQEGYVGGEAGGVERMLDLVGDGGILREQFGHQTIGVLEGV